MPAAILASRY